MLTNPEARALYTNQAAIPEELSFEKGEILAVFRRQGDGWWEAEVVGKEGQRGLAPSNYLCHILDASLSVPISSSTF